ncbi:DUF1566 domain-containing protein [Desulfonatronovibrio magnus]|uniref:Lcl C-terminal domain-containing protein n=1 Tax=Desulfonatronovibrio magnus TaxID=698827 RepID=UPI0005EBCD11|nr:DUF1566 domain-containing protein [Desulfonatronovibrio magnus]
MIKISRVTIVTVALMLCLISLVLSGSAFAQRFVDNGDGTVTDTMTRLMWTKDADPFGRLNWEDAVSRCESFSISGIGGWRLPSMDELVALSHAMQGGHPFTGIQYSPYWSSTTDAPPTDIAWFVNMHNGTVYNFLKTRTYHVWPVRSGR